MAAIALCKFRVFFCCSCLLLTPSPRVNECPTQRPHRPPGQPPAHTILPFVSEVCFHHRLDLFLLLAPFPHETSFLCRVLFLSLRGFTVCREDLAREASGKLWPKRRGDFSHLYQWVPHIRGFSRPQIQIFAKKLHLGQMCSEFFSCLCSGNNTAQQLFTQLHSAL